MTGIFSYAMLPSADSARAARDSAPAASSLGLRRPSCPRPAAARAAALPPGVVAMTYLARLDAASPVARAIAAVPAPRGAGDAGPDTLIVPVVVLASQPGSIAAADRRLESATDTSVMQQLVDDPVAWARQAWEHAAFATRARAAVAQLTPRERDVLDGLASGWPNKVIAHHCAISPRTVEIHRARVMAKLGCASLSHALRIAFAAGLGEQGDAPADPALA